MKKKLLLLKIKILIENYGGGLGGARVKWGVRCMKKKYGVGYQWAL
jgi:hypothetical protein